MTAQLEGQVGETIVQLGEHAMRLTPGKRLAIAIVVAGCGIALLFDVRGRTLPPLPYGLMVVGIAIAVSALRARQAQKQLVRQLTEVAERWSELEAGMQAEIAAGRSAVRYLQAAGISRFEVRSSHCAGSEANSLPRPARAMSRPRGHRPCTSPATHAPDRPRPGRRPGSPASDLTGPECVALQDGCAGSSLC
jgi:hypothetical protein